MVVDGPLQVRVVNRGHGHLREQILDDPHEQRQVEGQEFGHVGVSEGSDQNDVFRGGWVRPSQCAGHDQD